MKTVVVPPLLCSPLAYLPVLDTLWSRGQVTFADTRRDHTITGMAKRVLRENKGDFALFGTSMGGYVALEIMRQVHARVTGLALVSTTARADSLEQRQSRARQSALVQAGHFTALIDAAFTGVVAAANETNETLLTTWRSMTTPVGAEAFLHQHNAVARRADLRSELPTILCPTAIVHGTEDRLIPITVAEETATAVPNATYTGIGGAGHLLFHEQPTAARAAINEWLDAAS